MSETPPRSFHPDTIPHLLQLRASASDRRIPYVFPELDQSPT